MREWGARRKWMSINEDVWMGKCTAILLKKNKVDRNQRTSEKIQERTRREGVWVWKVGRSSFLLLVIRMTMVWGIVIHNFSFLFLNDNAANLHIHIFTTRKKKEAVRRRRKANVKLETSCGKRCKKTEGERKRRLRKVEQT